MKLRQIRSEEIVVGAAFIVGDWNVEIIGPLWEDEDGNPATRELPNATIRRGWWCVTGPHGPMRVRTMDLRAPVDEKGKAP